MLTKREKFLLVDLKINSSQSSWDWEADNRFNKEFKIIDDDGLGDALVSSDALAHSRMAVHQIHFEKVKRARLRVLNGLVKKKLVRAFWVGTGFGGKTDFGVSRCRGYQSTEAGLLAAEKIEGF